jgi:hypothetical protein
MMRDRNPGRIIAMRAIAVFLALFATSNIAFADKAEQ